jgi:exodeoxyribonuclease VII large subunit
LVVESLDPVGAGSLRIAYEQLRDRLQKEGLFASELKRPLPMLPRRVGVVTSRTGAAIRDVLNVISRRTRTVHVLFSPARVQGEGASSDIARAIRLINDYHQRALRSGRIADMVDVLIVGRGGGSTEDLWAFNEEEVARAIRASAIPVISAVGHETDYTIADFVADKRAPTPSAAAELVAAQEDQICTTLERLAQQLSRLMRYRIASSRNRVHEHALSQVFEEVRARLREARGEANNALHELQALMGQSLAQSRARIDRVNNRLSPSTLQMRLATAKTRFGVADSSNSAAIEAHLENARGRLALAAASLDALSPLAVLQRGYAIAEDQHGRLLRAARDASIGDRVRVRLAQGGIKARVEQVEDERE